MRSVPQLKSATVCVGLLAGLGLQKGNYLISYLE
jgi:hypothetical protein